MNKEFAMRRRLSNEDKYKNATLFNEMSVYQ